MIRPRRHTVRVRVFALCTMLAIVSLGIVAAGYLVAQRSLEAELDDRLTRRAAVLTRVATEGRPALLAAIERYDRRSMRTFSYRLVDADGRLLYGNGPATSPTLGWHAVSAADLDDQAIEDGRALTVQLSGGDQLTLIADTDYIDIFDRILLLLLVGSFALMSLCALAGGLYLERVVIQRLSAVNDIAATLARLPDLEQRVPLTGRHDEFDAVATTFNAMLDRIAGLVAENMRFTGYVAHDLRAPLVKLAERLADAKIWEGAGAGASRLLTAAEDDISEILNLFDAFLTIGQRDAGTAGVSIPIDLSARVTELADSFAVVADASGRTLRASITPGLWIDGSDPLIAQLIVNLIENAIRHTPRHTSIRVLLACVGNFAQLIVADDARDIEGSGRRARASMGDRQRLGLKLVRSVAESHGGSFTLVPCAHGTTAQVMLPLDLSHRTSH